ncbi:hypothetical protein BU24DRAFT_338244 [Aaosphaeria arxii CBS 175.79]|uniref:Uncharacterized protein n=1 Tax=Aaosphaeria arxii CBS 175.79 TaxID=1450172 RepID=A0A6A5YCU9_9PLEO|nr:uncharacterized protein BU24DRAFT_338244 [Aaosphaeria arxii CBS 175.79]KAF2022424.1 hypothetical protein BU24DRAFT_338244 [Aaosphaeria arxii CBS 175.79]
MPEPIAVVGFAFEFPGNIRTEDAFWDMLVDRKVDAPTIPKDRFNPTAFGPVSEKDLGAWGTQGAHFLREDVGAFDAPFFSISPAEAEGMDPQQRKLLETTYHALENAGIPMDSLRGSKTSVHVGCFTGDYHLMQCKDPDTMPTYHATGNSSAILANRISWFFDLKGPSVMMDTACSSSLVALDQACQALRQNQTSMGIVCGCNLILTPESVTTIGKMGFLSPDGLCHSFDERGNGYARSEGLASLVVKRVSDAIRDKDTIRCVIQATSTNQDGRTINLAQPCEAAQEELLRSTYDTFNLDRSLTRFCEAHGTGTAVGDPIEMNALSSSFHGIRNDADPLFIGATKANLGHLEAASGVAGIIKTILVLEKALIPPIAQLQRVNFRIKAHNLKFPTELTPWPCPGPRRASVQSFGFGGTNAHAILDDAANFLESGGIPYDVKPRTDSHHSSSESQLAALEESPRQLLVWSAPNKPSLERVLQSYSRCLADAVASSKFGDEVLPSLAQTLSERRTRFPQRAFVVSHSVQQLESSIRDAPVVSPSVSTRKMAFIFTGQGAQWLGMGRELLAYPIFEQSILHSQHILYALGASWDLLSVFRHKTGIDATIDLSTSAEKSQCVCTALQIALVDLTRSFNVVPDHVVGHSSGEIGAAYAIGAISVVSAMRLAYFRGKLSDELAADQSIQGSMMAVSLSEREVEQYLASINLSNNGQVVVGCINSSRSLTLSGPRSKLAALETILQNAGVFARMLKVPVAYHSPQMQTIAAQYEAAIGEIEKGNDTGTEASMISSVTGAAVLPQTLQDAKYWVSNLVSCVRFSDAVAQFMGTAHNILEIGPHGALKSPIQDIADDLDAGTYSYSSALLRFQSATETLLKAMGELYCHGHGISILSVNEPLHHKATTLRPNTQLPPYPFDHSTRYWHESRLSKSLRLRNHAPHPLLGVTVADWNPLEPRWRHFLRLDKLSFIEDHLINNTIVYPAAAMIAAVLEGAKQLGELQESGSGVSGYEIRDARFINALVFPTAQTEIEVELRFRKSDHNRYDYRLYSYRDENWTHHCEGTVRVQYDYSNNETVETPLRTQHPMRTTLSRAVESFEGISLARERVLDNDHLYNQLFHKFGYQYGTTFQGLHSLASDGKNKATATIIPLEGDAKERANISQSHVIHPAALDAVLQLALVAAARGGEGTIPTVVPERINRLWVSSLGLNFPSDDGTEVKVVAESVMQTKRKMGASASAFSSNGRNLLIHVQDFEGTSISNNEASSSDEQQITRERVCYRMEWQPDHSLMSSEQLADHCWGKITPVVPELDILAFEREATVLIFRSIFNVQKRLSSGCIQLAKPYFQKYVDWMEIQRHAFNSGVYPEVRSRYDFYQANDSALKNLRERVAANKLWRFYGAVADRLFDMLTGSLDPLQLLFGEEYATDFYAETNRYSRCGPALARYLTLLAHKNPGMRILEVGAGTGSTTRIALEALKTGDDEMCRFSRYDFTDISPSLVAAAQEELGHANRKMRFAQFDIEKSPGEQKFDIGSYDVIIAGSVLHATASISETLKNVRALLRPGGKLLLFENTRPEHVRMGFAFGLLPGWWLGVEDYRKHSPCLNTEQWDTALRKSGFSGAEVEFRDFEDKEIHETSVIIGTAVESVATEGSDWPLIIADVYNDVDMALAERIRVDLQRDYGVGCIVGSLQKMASSPAVAGRCCILLDIRPDSTSMLESESSYLAVQMLVQKASTLLWVIPGGGRQSNSPRHGLISGLSRTVRREIPNLRFISLALENPEHLSIHQSPMIVAAYKQSQESASYEPELVEIDGSLHINRVLDHSSLDQKILSDISGIDTRPRSFGEGVPLKLSTNSDSNLDSLFFEEDTDADTPLEADEIQIQVRAIGCNFLDALSALGRIDVDFMGLEVAGIVSKVGANVTSLNVGDAVVSFAIDAYRSYVKVQACLALPLPTRLSFVAGASIPINFATAYRALVEVASLQEGETVLIHSAAGGTGQAAVQIAKHVGATVLATVSTDEKRQFLSEKYQIQPEHIFSSRDDGFLSGIHHLTGGRGVDVVLNSLSGDLLHASWECIAPYGRFIEIGKKDIKEGTRINMAPFAANTTFSSVDLAAMIRQCPQKTGRLLSKVLDLMAENRLSTIMQETFSIDCVGQALRQLLGGKSLGKMVIEVDQQIPVKATTRIKREDLFSDAATYIIAGGLGGLGRMITRWMEKRGARHFVLLSRSRPTSTDAAEYLDELRVRGICVETPSCNIGDFDALSAALARINSSMPPVRGCIQASMVLEDSVFENMSHDTFNIPLEAKVKGSWNLHQLLPSDLDFFVMLSSVAGIFGSGGQANYAAGNTYQDALAHYRQSRGQHAVSIDLGMMLSEGYLANSPETVDRLEKTDGLIPIREEAFFAVLDDICNVKNGHGEAQVILGLGSPESMRERGITEPWWMEQPLFRALHQLPNSSSIPDGESSAVSSQQKTTEIGASFRSVKDMDALRSLTTDALMVRLNRTVPGTFPDEEESRLAKAEVPLHSLGVDSLVAVELRNWFKKSMGADIATFEILGGVGVKELARLIVERSVLCNM